MKKPSPVYFKKERYKGRAKMDMSDGKEKGRNALRIIIIRAITLIIVIKVVSQKLHPFISLVFFNA